MQSKQPEQNTKIELIQTLKSLPHKSGIYQYYDAQGHLLYVGKAKNLYNRVRSYFRVSDATPATNLSPRIYHMILKVSSIQTIILNHEYDALILENSLIKQLKPRYNILLRDDKTYPYIYIDTSSPYPRPQITRIKRKGKSNLYFGPFCSGSRDILDSLYEIFPLVQKANCLREKKACLFYQIGRCFAPCEGKITQEQYAQILQEAILHLKDKRLLLQKLEEKMLLLAQQERFEEALILRDRIHKLTPLATKSSIDIHTLEANWDIFAIQAENKIAVLVKLYMRDGKLISSDYEKIPFSSDKLEESELLSLYQQALLNHYQRDLPYTPSALLLPYELKDMPQAKEWEEFLKQRQNIKLLFPQKGAKMELIRLAYQNAKEILKLKDNELEIKEGIKDLFDLPHTPHRIEVFDTSHHSGKNNVGGMIVYENGEFVKSSYRHYLLEGSDEYSQMQEMLVRRAKEFATLSPPDLWLIDGGIAQINLAQEILESSGSIVPVISISKEKLDHKAHRAKGRAKDKLRGYVKGEMKEYSLLPSDKRLQLCQKLRDEAHRWAITFHRKKKLEGFVPR